MPALPADPQDVAKYIEKLAQDGRKASTIQTKLTAIGQAHLMSGYESPRSDPRLRASWAAILRRVDTKQRHVTPLVVEDIKRIVDELPHEENYTLYLRDKALLLTAFVGALKRSELVAINFGDLEVMDEGILVRIRKVDGEHERTDRRVGIPLSRSRRYCPVIAMNEWLSASGIRRGAVFRPVDRHENVRPSRLTTFGVANIVKRAVERTGLKAERYSTHSLRSGFMTAAARAGRAEREIMDHTGHRTVMIVREYVRKADPWRNNAAEGLL